MPKLIRNIDAQDFFELFFISAIFSILTIRSYLFVTGFPKIGGDNLHIAHMLWGGMFMLIAIYLLLTYMGKWVGYTAAILGGIGFGTFIDELGKFITNDNNYFYQPTIALIYAIFIILYLIAHFSQRMHKFSSEEYLINALDILKESVLLDLDKNEQKRALALLKKTNQKSDLVQAVYKMFREIETIPVSKPTLLDRAATFLRDLYFGFLRKKWFSKILIVFFLLQAIGTVFQALEVYDVFSGYRITNNLFHIEQPVYSFWDYGELLSSLGSGIFVVLGVIRMRFSRLWALMNFKRATLISLFLTNFFSFYEEQFLALIGVVFSITILLALDYMIKSEKDLKLPVEN